MMGAHASGTSWGLQGATGQVVNGLVGRDGARSKWERSASGVCERVYRNVHNERQVLKRISVAQRRG